MISSFALKFGRGPSVPAEQIDATPVTVFVGPNNSGKSKILTEIESYCRSGTKNSAAAILDHITFNGLGSDEAQQAIDHMRQSPNPNEAVNPDHIIIGGRGGARHQVPFQTLLRSVQNPTGHISIFCSWFLTHGTVLLDGRGRISLVNQQPAGDLQQLPQSSLQVLFRDDARRAQVRRIVSEAFGSYFVIDPTQLGQLRIRLAARPPNQDMEERGVHAAAVQFHSTAQLIDFASDGVKAFVGIIIELIAGDPKIILIDEPEAFLHPSLAYKPAFPG